MDDSTVPIRSRLWPRGRTIGCTAELLRRRYTRPVLTYITYRAPIGIDPEEVTAEVFVAAFQAVRRCPEPGVPADDPALAWILGIARHKLADAARRASRRRETSLETLAQWPAVDDPHTEAVSAQERAAVRALLAALAPEHREVLLLKYVDGLSLVEIGRLIGRTPEAVSSRLQRARAAAQKHGGALFATEEL
jgi:RNA polymerase sigma-70 factor (ECF subfamily)